MRLMTALLTPGGIVELYYDAAGYRWLTQSGEDTETSGQGYEDALRAGLAAWPDGVVVVHSEYHTVGQAEMLKPFFDEWLTT